MRAAGDTEDITIAGAEALNTYHITTKKWLGRVTIALISGPDVLCNYLFAVYYDNFHQDYILNAFDIQWQGDGTDASADVILSLQENPSRPQDGRGMNCAFP